MFYETEIFRAVHACWDTKNIHYLQSVLSNNLLTDDMIFKSAKKGTDLNHAIEYTLKGKEINMPEGKSFTDKDGTIRKKIRIKWWEDPSQSNYKDISIEPLDTLTKDRVNIDRLTNLDYYVEDDKPVFFGHYWLKGKPSLYRQNICCLDYSVAKNGFLVAYRFDGEKVLTNDKLVYV